MRPIVRVHSQRPIKAFLEENASIVTTGRGDNYFYLPFWFKIVGENGILEMHDIDNIPEELKEFVLRRRDDENTVSAEMKRPPYLKSDIHVCDQGHYGHTTYNCSTCGHVCNKTDIECPGCKVKFVT